ncbi:DUF1028 domain-containing protein [Nocardioides acrostichi]|uniref:DUF1028 domain-containing protein n=1 Tax=Nocardioides acrostichi TaxID=2784339 RepID=A0A930Y511_9ACTN|nr:DUF1028 domain-containing protein [Nocardioides acrostichi]MBF4160775.1 DUF1028 domain-containing protein [Nocardioides acrostichi]
MTLSLVVAVPKAGLLAAATASFSLSVGNSVPAVWPGVGAVVSQAWTNRSLRGRLLAHLAAGARPDQAVATLGALDPEPTLRQVGLVDAAGRSAWHTGSACTPFAGEIDLGTAVHGVVLGNLLVGRTTLEATAGVLGDAPPPQRPGELAALALTALRAGQRAGGDSRGQQSAALLVGAGPAQDWTPPDLAVDLRVDDHHRPLEELARLLELRSRTA